VKLGRLPVSYPWVWLQFQRAAKAAAIEQTGHALSSPQLAFLAGRSGNRHCRSAEADAHSDIRTTLNTYGDVGYQRNGRDARQGHALSAVPTLVI
jgi:hypothetical protein